MALQYLTKSSPQSQRQKTQNQKKISSSRTQIVKNIESPPIKLTKNHRIQTAKTQWQTSRRYGQINRQNNAWMDQTRRFRKKSPQEKTKRRVMILSNNTFYSKTYTIIKKYQQQKVKPKQSQKYKLNLKHDSCLNGDLSRVVRVVVGREGS